MNLKPTFYNYKMRFSLHRLTDNLLFLNDCKFCKKVSCIYTDIYKDKNSDIDKHNIYTRIKLSLHSYIPYIHTLQNINNIIITVSYVCIVLCKDCVSFVRNLKGGQNA